MSGASVKKESLQTLLASASEAEMQARLRTFAQELAGEITAAAPEQSDRLLSLLIAELAMSAADQRRRSERRARQQECIAAAKARGVQFGRRRLPLPEEFEEYCQAWQNGELSLREAAASCGMEKTTFQRAAMRRKEQNPAL